MLPEQFVYLGIVTSFISAAVYLFETIKGIVQPNRVTFFLWATAPFIACAAQVSQGVGIQALLTFSMGFGSLLIFAASFLHRNKKTAWKLGRFDYACGTLSLVGLFLWQVTQVGNIAILFSILADAFAAIPTIVKSYKQPQTESALAYLFAGIGGLIICLTVNNWNFATYGFALYTIIINAIIFVTLHFKLGKRLSS